MKGGKKIGLEERCGDLIRWTPCPLPPLEVTSVPGVGEGDPRSGTCSTWARASGLSGHNPSLRPAAERKEPLWTPGRAAPAAAVRVRGSGGRAGGTAASRGRAPLPGLTWAAQGRGERSGRVTRPGPDLCGAFTAGPGARAPLPPSGSSECAPTRCSSWFLEREQKHCSWPRQPSPLRACSASGELTAAPTPAPLPRNPAPPPAYLFTPSCGAPAVQWRAEPVFSAQWLQESSR